MKFFQEITPGDNYPNHVYMLSDNREFMHGYVQTGQTELRQFKTRYRFDTKGRKFTEVSNTYGYVETPLEATTERWEVQGSSGNRYVIERDNGRLKCSCTGFRFKGKCRHIQVTA